MPAPFSIVNFLLHLMIIKGCGIIEYLAQDAGSRKAIGYRTATPPSGPGEPMVAGKACLTERWPPDLQLLPA